MPVEQRVPQRLPLYVRTVLTLVVLKPRVS